VKWSPVGRQQDEAGDMVEPVRGVRLGLRVPLADHGATADAEVRGASSAGPLGSLSRPRTKTPGIVPKERYLAYDGGPSSSPPRLRFGRRNFLMQFFS